MILVTVSYRFIVASIGIRLFSVDAFLPNDVVVCEVRISTVTTLVAVRTTAVEDVLFRQRHQLARLSEMLTLERAGSAKGIARSTGTLKDENNCFASTSIVFQC